MKYLKKLIIIQVIFLIGIIPGRSQSVESNTFDYALGIRAGETSGITFKHNKNDVKAFEGIAGIWGNGISFTGLFEKYAPAFDIVSMRWYYGLGGHCAFRTNSYYAYGRQYARGDDLGLGVDGVVGLEYKIPPIPFAVSLDVKPFIEVNTGGNIFLELDPGLGIKYTF